MPAKAVAIATAIRTTIGIYVRIALIPLPSEGVIGTDMHPMFVADSSELMINMVAVSDAN